VYTAITDDDRYVGFGSAATNLVPWDTNGHIDVFLHDRTTDTTERISLSSSGKQANLNCEVGSVSRDGWFVSFQSYASNLVPRDTNNARDGFVRDRQTHSTERITVASNGQQGNDNGSPGQFSADATFVSFGPYASNLIPGDTNGKADVFLRRWP
jgi:hypothetical protein